MPSIDLSHALVGRDVTLSDDEDGFHPSRRLVEDGDIPALDIGNASEDEDFYALAQAATNRKSGNVKGRSVKKGGGFQAMGLGANLLKAITRKGFTVPTPIQRRAIPIVLAGLDVVGMARTGSGKTAAFVVPMIERLKNHSAKVGARALVLAPSRELALQTLKVVRELGRGTDLKSVLLVGGDSLEQQFALMAGNPDVIIATPGRFLHLQVEMKLDLSSMQYVVFDEADRLFETGFAPQLTEILHALPSTRQTLLFSATLPKSLVEFAKAGLQEPHLIRLDAESKISPDLQNAFFSVKSAEKDAALLHILQDVIKLPREVTASHRAAQSTSGPRSKKRKRSETQAADEIPDTPSEEATIVFAATKYHVEHIAQLLKIAGYAVSYAYGSLDQTARKIQVQNFRSGLTNILVVTDVAARGIDIPILANVINHSFPAQPKIFVHRVGRTARAGRQGWSYSLVRDSDLPYLLDLQLFLGRRLLVGRSPETKPQYAHDVVVGNLATDSVARCGEWVQKMLDENADLESAKTVAGRAEKQYMRTRSSASTESAKRARTLLQSPSWHELHPLFEDTTTNADLEREKMLARVSKFRPAETIFEVGRQGKLGVAGEVVKKRRGQLEAKKQRRSLTHEADASDNESEDGAIAAKASQARADGQIEDANEADETIGDDVDMDSASSSELEVTFSHGSHTNGSKSRSRSTQRNSEVYMAYAPSALHTAEERGYAVHNNADNGIGSSFAAAAQQATLDLADDESQKLGASRQTPRWDKRHKKYVMTSAADSNGKKGGTEQGSRGLRANMIRGESGAPIAASFRSGRFDAWQRTHRLGRFPRVGETEDPRHTALARAAASNGPSGTRRVPVDANPARSGRPGSRGSAGSQSKSQSAAADYSSASTSTNPSRPQTEIPGRHFRHRQTKAPKAPDRFRDDYHVQKRRVKEAQDQRVGRFRDGPARSDLRGLDQVRKERVAKARRREKTGRHRKK